MTSECGDSLAGYYCHTAQDLCTNDSDCPSEPGSAGIPTTIGALTLGVTVLSAIAAFTARETYRLHLNDLGDPQAAPVPLAEYEAARVQATPA